MKTTRILVSLLCATLLGAAHSASAAANTAHAPKALPNSMTALGDSITKGFNACGWYSDCPDSSWSTGSNAAVNSHFLRIKKTNPAIGNKVFNDARSGAKIADLPAQATTAVSRNVDYVTILMGANDICTRTEEQMTSVTAYRTHLDTALATLKKGLPNATIRILTLPDVKRLWGVAKDDASARNFWSTFNICQSLLANPTSTAPADMDRRERVRQRAIEFNTQLAQACAAYGSRCSFDDYALFNYQFQFSQVSRWDFFHPNADGQKVLAEITYRLS